MEGALVSAWWLTLAYAFHTFGELCLSPIGLSLVTKLAPLKVSAVMMGVWFLSTAIAELIAGQLAALTERVAAASCFTCSAVRPTSISSSWSWRWWPPPRWLP